VDGNVLLVLVGGNVVEVELRVRELVDGAASHGGGGGELSFGFALEFSGQLDDGGFGT